MAKEVLTDSVLFLRETAETAFKQTKARRKIAVVLIIYFLVYFLLFFDLMIIYFFLPLYLTYSSLGRKVFSEEKAPKNI